MSEDIVEIPGVDVYRWCLSGDKRAPTEGVAPDLTNEKSNGYLDEALPTHLEMNGMLNNHGEWLHYLKYIVPVNNTKAETYYDELNDVSGDYSFISDDDFDEEPIDPKPEYHDGIPVLDKRIRHRESQLYTKVIEDLESRIEIFEGKLAAPGPVVGCEIKMSSNGSFTMTAGTNTIHRYNAQTWNDERMQLDTIANSYSSIFNAGRTDWNDWNWLFVSGAVADGKLFHIFLTSWETKEICVDTDANGSNIYLAYIAYWADNHPDEDQPLLYIRRICTDIIKRTEKDFSSGTYMAQSFTQQGNDFIVDGFQGWDKAFGRDPNLTKFWESVGKSGADTTALAYDSRVSGTLSKMFSPTIPNGVYTIEVGMGESDDDADRNNYSQIEVDDGNRKIQVNSSGAFRSATGWGATNVREFRCPGGTIEAWNTSNSTDGLQSIYALRFGVLKWRDMRGQDGYIRG